MKRVLLGTCALVAVLTTSPQAQPPRTAGVQPPDQHRPVREVVLEGCLVAGDVIDQGGRRGGAPPSGAATAGTDEVFLLRHATHGSAASTVSTERGADPPDQADRAVQGSTPSGQQSAYQQSTQGRPDASASTDANREATYRLTATGSGVNLRAHVGHRIEVQGRVADVRGSGMPDGREAGGQSGLAPEGTQHGQGGQQTTTPANTQAGQRVAAGDGVAGRTVTIVMVTSVRMIASSCRSAEQPRE